MEARPPVDENESKCHSRGGDRYFKEEIEN